MVDRPKIALVSEGKIVGDPLHDLQRTHGSVSWHMPKLSGRRLGVFFTPVLDGHFSGIKSSSLDVGWTTGGLAR